MPRITWPDLPDAVRDFVEATLGSPVVAWSSQSGGYSPGTADRLTCADGSRAFLKAVSTEQNPDSPDLYRREAEVMAAMPPHVPVPALLGAFDDGAWVAVLLQDVEGRLPSQPWVAAELDATLAALTEIQALMTPCPIPGRPQVADEVREMTTAWETWLTDGAPADLDPWAAARLPELAERRRRALAALVGDGFVHHDLRHDNVLILQDGSAVIVDWPWACTGAPWYDATLLSLQLMGADGPDADAHLDRVAATYGTTREPLEDTLLTILAYFERQTRLPAPQGLPTLRAAQRAQADAILGWAKTRL